MKSYNEIPTNDTFKKGDICETFEYNDKRKIWDLTFQMGECYNTGQIRTQYDDVIELIVEGVLYDNHDINKIYIPLLFLVRHSLELALKSNLYEAKRISPDKDTKKQYDFFKQEYESLCIKLLCCEITDKCFHRGLKIHEKMLHIKIRSTL